VRGISPNSWFRHRDFLGPAPPTHSSPSKGRGILRVLVKALDKEITEIDLAIGRLVYDLYELTEDEIKTVKQSVWREKFEEMYGKLPGRDKAINIAKFCAKKS